MSWTQPFTLDAEVFTLSGRAIVLQMRWQRLLQVIIGPRAPSNPSLHLPGGLPGQALYEMERECLGRFVSPLQMDTINAQRKQDCSSSRSSLMLLPTCPLCLATMAAGRHREAKAMSHNVRRPLMAPMEQAKALSHKVNGFICLMHRLLNLWAPLTRVVGSGAIAVRRFSPVFGDTYSRYSP